MSEDSPFGPRDTVTTQHDHDTAMAVKQARAAIARNAASAEQISLVRQYDAATSASVKEFLRRSR